MTLTKRTHVTALAGSLAIAVLLSACDQAPQAQASAGSAPPPPPVEAATPLIKPIVEWDEYTGRFEAVERVELRARVSGYLNAVHFKDGQIVHKGDLLFTIDPRPFQAELARAKADVASAQAHLALSERELARAEKLVTSRAISEETADNRRTTRTQAVADLEAARAGVVVATLNLEFTEIRAPVTGRISDRKVDVGNLVTGGTDSASLLANIVALDPIHFVFTMSEAEYLKHIRRHGEGGRPIVDETGDEVHVRLMDDKDWSRVGRMDFLDNALDPNSGTIRGRAVFDNPDLFLTPGTFGRLRLAGVPLHDATMVPDAAILSDQSNKIVMTVTADGTVVPKPVVLGPVVDGLRVIRSGLGPEDKVIVKGLQRARPGGKVTVQPTTIAAKSGPSTTGG